MVVGKKQIDFTSGRLLGKILWFVLPIIATNLLQTFYNAADMVIVSLSDEANAVGAVGTTSSFIHLIVNVFIGFSVGANVIVARHIGSKNEESTSQAVHTALIMSVILGLIGMSVGILITKPVLKAMGNRANLLNLAVKYCLIYFLGVPFLSLTNYLIAIFRAKGDAKTPLIVLSLAGVLNVLLNIFFVLVCKTSVEGVAIATAISNFVSAIALLIKLKKDQDYTTFSFKKLTINVKAMKDIILIGFPAGIQGALFSLSNVLIQSSVVSVNNLLSPPESMYQPVVSGYSAATNVDTFVYTAMNGVYQGAITFTSQNVGAEKPQNIKRIMYSCFLIVSIIGIGLGWSIYFFRAPLLSLYGVGKGADEALDALALYAAKTKLLYVCIPYFLCGLMDVTTGVLRGLGKSVTSTIIALIGTCALRIFWVMVIFPLDRTLETILWSYPISWTLTGFTSFIVIQVLLKKILRKRNEFSKTEENILKE